MYKLGYLLIGLLIIGCTTAKQNTSTDGVNTEANNDNTKTKRDSIKDKIDDYFKEDYDKLKTGINYSSIKTLLVHRKNWELSEAAMKLNGNDTLIFSFDEITSDLGNYYFTIIHCNADWTKSDLLESEYMDGFFQDFISNFKYSFNTLEQFIHYEVQLPNKNIKLTKSGNYIFKVYNDNNPDDVVLTKRFMVYENVITTEAQIVRPTILDDRDDKQEVDFNLDIGELVVNNIYDDIKVSIRQNNRWDNEITDLKPRFIRGSIINYDYNKENVFNGTNEYRFLNIKSLRYRGQKVKSILVENKQTYVELFPEEKRTYKNYLNYEDLNGNYIIRIQTGVDSRAEADYAYVKFSIKSHEEQGGEVYIIGGLTNYQIDENFKLTYNESNQAYEGTFLLKQGYYDYHYAMVKNGKTDVPFFEGNHFEAINNYTITTYLRDPQFGYDRIIGYFNVLSNR